MDKPLSAPLSVTINVTERCNLACRYCYARTEKSAPHMPAEMAVDLAKDFNAKGVWRLVIGGGEPFLHPEIIRILSEILEAGIDVAVISNGIPIAKHYEELVSLSRRFGDRLWLQISVDGPTAEINDQTRGNGKAAFRIVDRLVDDGVALQLATVVTRYNVSTADQIVDVFYPGVRLFHYMNLMPSRKLLLEGRDLWADDADLDDLWSRLADRANRLPGIHISMPDCGADVLAQRPTMDCPGCTAGFTRVDINVNGDVAACNMADGSVMGNLHSQSFEDIWLSYVAAGLRARELPLCHVPELQFGRERSDRGYRAQES